MDLRIVLHGELGKRVAVGILDEQELAALSAAGNDRLRLNTACWSLPERYLHS